MKRIIIIIMILLMNVLAYGQGVKLNNAPPLHYGKYTSVTNSSEISIGNDIINAEGLSYDLLYMINANDTSFSLNKVVPQYYGQWNSLTNNNKIIFGNDTANKGDISARLVYLMNSNIATTDGINRFTATNYFNKLIVDTMIVNRMDSVHSTYWFSNAGDTIGYIDASTSKVAFLKNINLAGDTTIAKKVFAQNITIVSGVLELQGGSYLGTECLYFANPIFRLQGYDYDLLRVFVPFRVNVFNTYIDSNLTISKNLTVNNILNLKSITTPSSPATGNIYSDGTHCYFYNGTVWKQLDN